MKNVVDVENERRLRDQQILDKDLKNMEKHKLKSLIQEGKVIAHVINFIPNFASFNDKNQEISKTRK